MIGEIWESSETWLNGDMFDSTMNYDSGRTVVISLPFGKFPQRNFMIVS